MTLARTIASPFNSPLPWEPQGGNRIDDTPIAIFGASNVKLMLDYTLGVTLGTPPAVAAWADQSGNANNASQGTAGNRPTLAANGIAFDGSTHCMDIADNATLDATTKMILGIAFAPDKVTGNMCPITKSTTVSGAWGLQSSGAAMRMHFTSVGVNFSEGGTMSAGVLQRMIHEYDGDGAANADRLKLYLNSASASALAFTGTVPASLTNSTNVVRLGAWANDLQYLDGTIRRVAIIFGTSTAAQRARFDAWLSRA